MLSALTVVLVSVVLAQFEQTKRWTMVVGFAATNDERDHFISFWQFGQTGGTRCSSDFLSLSTMAACHLFPTYAVDYLILKIKLRNF